MSALATTARRAIGGAERTPAAPAPTSRAGASAGLPRFAQEVVQAKCDACAEEEEEQRPAEPDDAAVQQQCAACEDEESGEGGGAGGPSAGAAHVHTLARSGTTGPGGPLPHLDRIQASFGHHDVSHARAHVGGAAAESSARMGALAYTVGSSIGFRSSPDVHLAAHEATHVVQQRRGVRLAGGVGRPGDVHERQADEVAEVVARGDSAEPILDRIAPPAEAPATGDAAAAVQHRLTVSATRRYEPPPPPALPVGGGAAPRAVRGGGGASAAPAEARGGGAATAEADGAGGGGEGDATAEGAPTAGGAGGAGGGGAGGAEAQAGGQAEPACAGGGGMNAACYYEGIEEPEEEPEEEPPEPEATKAEEEIESESPDAEEADDCPIGTAMEAGAPEGTTGPAAAAPGGAAAGTAGGGTPAAGEGGEAAPAGAAAAREGAARGGGGGGAGGGEAKKEGGLEEVPSPLDASIYDTEVARSEAVAAYLGSMEALGAAEGGLGGLTDDVTFAGEAPSAEAASRERTARSRARGFMGEAAGLVEDALLFAREQVPERLGGLAETFKGLLEVSIETQKAAISARVEQARGEAREQAGGARARVVGAHAETVGRIDAETDDAIGAITDAYLDALSAVDEAEPQALDDVNALYADSRTAHEDLGPLVGGDAITKGSAYVDAYEGCKIYERDSLTAGYLTDRRAEAQQNAARKTAEGYSKSMVKTAKKQAKVAMEGRKKDRCGVIATARRARDTADQQLDALTGALEASRTQAIAQADGTRDAMFGSIDSLLRGTLRDLDRQEQEQRQAANDVGYLQQVMLEQVAHAAAASVQNAVAQGTQMVLDALGQVRRTFASSPAPDAETLDAVLGQAASALRGGMGRLSDAASSGLVTAEGNVASAATRAFTALEGVTRANDEQTAERMDAAGQALGQLASGAVQSLAQQADGYATQAQKSGADGAAAMDAVATGFDAVCLRITDAVFTALLDSEGKLEGSLRESLASIDCEIPKQANLAASKEQPAWKSIVKWVLIIAIIIVVALVVGPAVIGAIGAAAASLGAGAAAAGVIGTVVGGAIVGAATSATITVVSNVAEGRTWYQGVGRAAIMGAIGGAFGAGAGALIGRATTSVALQIAGNVAADAVLEIGTQLVTGEFSLESLGMAVLMSAVTGGFGEVRGIKGIQQKWMVRGAGGVPGARAKAYADTLRPPTPGAPPETGGPRPVEEAAPRPADEAAPAPREVEAPRAAEPDTARVPRGEAEPPPPGRADRAAPRPQAEVEAEGARVAGRTGPGESPRLEAEPDVPANRRTDSELAEAAAPTRIGDEPHSVAPRKWLGETKLVACSPDCGPLTAKIDDILPDVPPKSPLHKELKGLKADIEALELKIESGKADSATIVTETNRIASRLTEIGEQHPHLGERLNAPPAARDAEIRAEHAGDWGVNPTTGRFDGRRRMQGLKADEVETRAEAPAKANEPDPVRRRRRHAEERAAEGDDAMDMKEWAESGFRANVNRDVSSPVERAALGQVGATPNNPAGQGRTFDFKESVDSLGRPVPANSPKAVAIREVCTRPDGTRPNDTGGTDIVEHKHLTGKTATLDDSPQLRAQRAMAVKNKGAAEIVISSDRALTKPRRGDPVPPVEPSGPLGQATRRIYYYDPRSGKITHQWSKEQGRWVEF